MNKYRCEKARSLKDTIMRKLVDDGMEDSAEYASLRDMKLYEGDIIEKVRGGDRLKDEVIKCVEGKLVTVLCSNWCFEQHVDVHLENMFRMTTQGSRMVLLRALASGTRKNPTKGVWSCSERVSMAGAASWSNNPFSIFTS